MRIKYFIIQIFVIVFISCNLDSSYTKGYFQAGSNEFGDAIFLEREDTIFFAGFEKSKKYFHNGTFIQFHYKGKSDTVFIWGESIVINSHINKSVSDSIFILVDQKPLDSIFGKMVYEPYPHRPFMPNTPTESFKTLKTSEKHCYWIINKISDDIYGPMNKREFEQKCKELYVSKIIIMEFEK